MSNIRACVVATLLMSAFAAFALNTQATITVSNKTTSTVSPSGVNYAGTLAPALASIVTHGSQTYVNTGVGNVISFRADYGNTAGKTCRFNASAFNQTTPTSPCVYNKSAQSVGTTSATCTAIITSASTSPSNCAFSVAFEVK